MNAPRLGTVSGARSFQAQYPGRCPDCRGQITLGDDVHYDVEGRIVHDACPLHLDDLNDAGTPCRNCFLIHAGECM
ncbi:Uncharacterised protein (plasmid) [Tsukamurella tyrosinosolvens]|uniref:Uncharacterized protein n=1 Tax=Tsukamurella tyrosinosolvens TaxID=57704 RepID=A0A1H4VLH8_TSUTY|nr:hypothetical protein [Tsukamurella tyrosinosolvens]KXO90946.1 hypothetical protein AXK58_21165 [Tsukamurella tyrosinosolvens]SEC81795.1 hypothetical protein SAMN04489793_3265 [Tsukamurella tyrosinosolvens]VEH90444.1 Uncharacterised protein [Tsukamurella tyrosinosolvens]